MTAPLPLQQLHAACLTHLAEEENCVLRLLEGVERLHQTVRAGQWSDLADTVTRLDPELAERDRLQRQRAELRARLATLGGAGGLDALTARLPAHDAARLSERRFRLRTLASDLERRSRRTAFLAGHHLEFFEGFFVALTRPPGAAPRYGRSGELCDAAPGSLIQAHG